MSTLNIPLFTPQWLEQFSMHYDNTPIQIYRKFQSPPKIEYFQIKKTDIFHISAQIIDCGYSLEPPKKVILRVLYLLNRFSKETAIESNEHTQNNENSWSVEFFWARLDSFLTSNPHITFQNSSTSSVKHHIETHRIKTTVTKKSKGLKTLPSDMT